MLSLWQTGWEWRFIQSLNYLSFTNQTCLKSLEIVSHQKSSLRLNKFETALQQVQPFLQHFQTILLLFIHRHASMSRCSTDGSWRGPSSTGSQFLIPASNSTEDLRRLFREPS